MGLNVVLRSEFLWEEKSRPFPKCLVVWVFSLMELNSRFEVWFGLMELQDLFCCMSKIVSLLLYNHEKKKVFFSFYFLYIGNEGNVNRVIEVGVLERMGLVLILAYY